MMKIISHYIVLTLLMHVLFVVHAQETTEATTKNVVIHRDVRLDTLVSRVLEENRLEQKISGYRIQVYSGSNRHTANQVKSIFMTSYPQIKSYLSYSQPYFRLRVGDFRTRTESLQLYHLLLADERFRSVLIVPDMIYLPELKKYTDVEREDKTTK